MNTSVSKLFASFTAGFCLAWYYYDQRGCLAFDDICGLWIIMLVCGSVIFCAISILEILDNFIRDFVTWRKERKGKNFPKPSNDERK